MRQNPQTPLPGSAEAHAQGCTCPDPAGSDNEPGRAVPLDENCPVHGSAAFSRTRPGEAGPVDTEGDIVDAASDAELRRNG